MRSLMPFQVMIPLETLGTLIALEGSLRSLRSLKMCSLMPSQIMISLVTSGTLIALEWSLKVCSLMPFQVTIVLETLGTLIAFEGFLTKLCWLRIPIHLLLQMWCAAAIVASLYCFLKILF